MIFEIMEFKPMGISVEKEKEDKDSTLQTYV